MGSRLRRGSLTLTYVLALLASSAAFAGQTQLLNLQADPEKGTVLLQLDQLPMEYLYVTALQSGVGSNDLGLDRGQLGRSRWVRFERYGNRVLLLEPNLKFRADNAPAAESRAVAEAFAQSVLAGFEILNPGEDAVRIDLSALLLDDTNRVAAHIAELEQGSFTLDPERSAIDIEGIRNFSQNTLIPSILTLQSQDPGAFVAAVTPTPDSLTIRVSHQFVQLPADDYRPRAFHPRSGYFALEYRNYAAGLGEPIERRLIYRHRLEPGQSLTYYVDNGTPEPIRSALLEGASWWTQAFNEAGFENQFRVAVLPDDADPLDVRYNVIQWVHRSTRGWSYGASVADPRSGEIIKGHVSLGSLRVRQDQLIAEALTAPFTAQGDHSQAAQEMALARLRQLSAHEVGHTLGIDHNFAASFSGDASVMDYPHPDLYLTGEGKVGIDRAYRNGISQWDRLAVRYGYTAFEPEQENAGLLAILDEAQRSGISFIADVDSRIPGSAHPAAHLWDNGEDVLARLAELMQIRQIGLQQFSTAVMAPGEPLFELERRLVPVYLLHRYQVEAAAKLMGGLFYDYRLIGEPETSLQPVDAATQTRALNHLMELLRPAALALPENLHYLIPPPASGYQRDREFFSGATGVSFDHLSPVRAGADLVIQEVLQPQRLARVVEQHALDQGLPGIHTVLERLLQASWKAPPPTDAYLRAIQHEVNWQVLKGLITLAAQPTTAAEVHAHALAALIELADLLQGKKYRQQPQAMTAVHQIRKFLERPAGEPAPPTETIPPGSPIG